jgi:peptidoglycan/xylan/chitin deacetylase (PgdA/CDA1 family)
LITNEHDVYPDQFKTIDLFHLMRGRLKIILGTAGCWIPQRSLIRLTGRRLILPYYHAVSDQPMPHVQHVYPVRTLRQFKKDLDFLLKHYEPVGPGELKSRSKPSMFLSFDDGLSEIYHVVSPVLIARGVPAAVFVNTEFIDNRALFYRYKKSLLLERFASIGYSPAVTELMQSRYHLASPTKKCIREFLLHISYENRQELDEIGKMVDLDFKAFLKVKKPYMSLEQIRELAGQGFYIGAHSKDHPAFAELPLDDCLVQYRGSMEFVLQEFGTTYGIFSFPFSDDGVPAEFFRRITQQGMPPLDASFGTAGLKNDPVPFHHHRIQMETGRVPARRLIRGEYLYYMAKGLIGKNEIRRAGANEDSG